MKKPDFSDLNKLEGRGNGEYTKFFEGAWLLKVGRERK